MKTLKEIVAAIDALPLIAFKDTYGGNSRDVDDALRRGYERWSNSLERALSERLEEEDRETRRQRDTQVRRERAANVQKWLADGTLVNGTFIKVSGARDGHGIREFISHDDCTVHCRQWLPVRFSRYEAITPDVLRASGLLKIDGRWLRPEAQMTTHGFDKVVKILS